MDDFGRSWGRAASGELAWLGAAGRPAALTAVPLLDGVVPCVALTYDRAAAVASLAGAGAVAFAVTDARSLPDGPGQAALGRVTCTGTEDLDEDLLDQELRRFPPARTLADSPLLRRENWWYLPRLVVRLDRVDRVVELPARQDPARDALLVRDDGGGLCLDVGSGDWTGSRVQVAGAAPLRGDGADTLAHGHDHSPDRERWEQWQVRGVLRGEVLEVTARVGRPGLAPGAPRLLERLRQARALEKGCRRGIAAAERRAR